MMSKGSFYRTDRGADARLAAMHDVRMQADALIQIARELDAIAEKVADEAIRTQIRDALRRMLAGTEGIVRSAQDLVQADVKR